MKNSWGGVIYVIMGCGKKKKKKPATEKSYHSYGFVCSSIYWNHLKWNETLMKTVEPIDRSKKEDRLKSFIERKQR